MGGLTGTVAAIDLGATSGRVIAAHVGRRTLELHQLRRFPNGPVRLADGLHWAIIELYRQILLGLRALVHAQPDVQSIGIDAWAVDYGLLRGSRLAGLPFHYRDDRTADGVATVHQVIPPAQLYQRNGLQFLPFNTVYQLTSDLHSGVLQPLDQALLIPDLLTYWLTGKRITERTNASTTGLLNVQSREWDNELLKRLGLPSGLLADLLSPGQVVGDITHEVRGDLGITRAPRLVSVGSHDTASAVAAAPMTEPGCAYISCGTWALVGVELDGPVLTEESRRANFSNEAGVDGRIRYLRNVMGLWLLNECMNAWSRDGLQQPLPELLAAAQTVPAHAVPLIDADNPVFVQPGDMPARITAHCLQRGLNPPITPVEMVRCIIESLADAFARAVAQAADLSGQHVRRIHIVGGGALNDLLCQRTADRAGLPVHAGPIEATAIGNVLVQARATGLVAGSLESLRDLVARTQPIRTFEPTPPGVLP